MYFTSLNKQDLAKRYVKHVYTSTKSIFAQNFVLQAIMALVYIIGHMYFKTIIKIKVYIPCSVEVRKGAPLEHTDFCAKSSWSNC